MSKVSASRPERPKAAKDDVVARVQWPAKTLVCQKEETKNKYFKTPLRKENMHFCVQSEKFTPCGFFYTDIVCGVRDT